MAAHARALCPFAPLAAQVNCAGVLNVRRTLTVDGIEETLAVNHLAPWLLTTSLLPLLKATAASPACAGRAVRVVTVGSDAQKWVKAFNYDDPSLAKGYGAATAYGQSKLANTLFTLQLADDLRAEGVVRDVAAAHATRCALMRVRRSHRPTSW
jgi:retinol dehydrogenase-12